MVQMVNPSPPLPYAGSSINPNELARFDADLVRALTNYLRDMAERANASFAIDGSTPMTGDLNLGGNEIVNMGLVGSASTFYQSGPIVPTFEFATPGTMSVAYTNQTGNYVRIGDVVTIRGFVSGTITKGTASGIFLVGGLPFPAVSTTQSLNIAFHSAGFTYPASISATWLSMYPADNTHLGVRGHASNQASANLTSGSITGGVALNLHYSGTYIRA